MNAIVKISGKQFKVAKDTKLFVNRIEPMINAGKYDVKIIASEHKNATMTFFVPPQDSNLRLPETNEGIEGINKFTFTMEKGTGTIDLEENVYIKIFSWIPFVYIFDCVFKVCEWN